MIYQDSGEKVKNRAGNTHENQRESDFRNRLIAIIKEIEMDKQK
jgi:hypothetical protein